MAVLYIRMLRVGAAIPHTTMGFSSEGRWVSRADGLSAVPYLATVDISRVTFADWMAHADNAHVPRRGVRAALGALLAYVRGVLTLQGAECRWAADHLFPLPTWEIHSGTCLHDGPRFLSRGAALTHARDVLGVGRLRGVTYIPGPLGGSWEIYGPKHKRTLTMTYHAPTAAV